MVVFLIAMSDLLPDLLPGVPVQTVIGPRAQAWPELAPATPGVLWGAWPFFVRAGQSVVSRHLNMVSLFGLGMGWLTATAWLPTALRPTCHWSQTTLHHIKLGFFFAFVYKLLGVPLVAGFVYPAFGIFLSPMLAAAAMSLSSRSVICKALRLRALKL